jgi:hypothetical protein
MGQLLDRLGWIAPRGFESPLSANHMQSAGCKRALLTGTQTGCV